MAKEFKPHMMYSKDGEEEMANTLEDHNRLSETEVKLHSPASFKMSGYPLHYGTSPVTKKNAAGKEQGADGKACWEGYSYAGTENGKDKCVPN